MKKLILLILLSFSLTFKNLIEEGVYNIALDDNNYLSFNNEKIQLLKCKKFEKDTLFRIKLNNIKNNFMI